MSVFETVLLGVLLTFLALLAAAAMAFMRHRVPDRSVESLLKRWAKPPSQFITIDGMRVHVRDEGPRNDAMPFVLLHGTGSSLHTWDGWARRFAKTRRVIRFDRPGFGLTGPEPEKKYGMAHSAEFTLRLLDNLGLERFALAGNSSGGCLAWHIALAAPQRVDRLVLLAASGYPRRTPLPFGLRVARWRWLTGLTSSLLPRSLVDRGTRDSYGDPSKVTAEIVDRSYELTLRKGNRKALGECLRQADEDDSSSISLIRMPALILWGKRDSVIPHLDALDFHRDLVGSKLLLYPTLGHLPQQEDAETTAAAVIDWLEE